MMGNILQRQRRSVVRKLNGRKRKRLAKRSIASFVMMTMSDVTVELELVRVHLDPANTRIMTSVVPLIVIVHLLMNYMLFDMRRIMTRWIEKENVREIDGGGT